MIFAIHKAAGQTPLEAMEALRARTPALAGEPMVYAGRLDPMAEGVLLVLTGADRYALPDHLRHDKEYEAVFLFGVSSDTFDTLGRLHHRIGGLDVSQCIAAVGSLTGTHTLLLPVWSAYRVRGRPLHAWAAEGRLGEIEVPLRAMVVRAVAGVGAVAVGGAAVAAGVIERIGQVHGTFRQAEAIADWQRLGDADPALLTVRATLTVESGTYIRALANELGERLGCGGLLLALRRTRVGPYMW